MKSLSSVCILPWSIILWNFLLYCKGVFGIEDLYDKNDKVIILDHHNYKPTVFGKDNVWIIEFYSSWCGHCVKFAPTWKEFSASIKEWEPTVKVGVVNCASRENLELCQDYEVTSTPSVRLFPPNIFSGFQGVVTRVRTVEDLQKAVIDYVVEQQELGKGKASWPPLSPVKNLDQYLPQILQNDKALIAVVLEKQDSYLGKDVALRLAKHTNVLEVHRVVKNIESSEFPVLLILSEKQRRELSLEGKTAEETATLINDEFRKIKGYSLTGNVHKPHVFLEKSEEPVDPVPLATDTVYYVDVENALSYALQHEVSLHKVISGAPFESLKSFIRVVKDFLPLKPALKRVFTDLTHKLDISGNQITSKQWLELLIDPLTGKSLLPDQKTWKRCLGSSSQYRGYNCGLWTIFHSLTIGTIEREAAGPYKPKHLLETIHGYVKHFFTCEHCSYHFQKMYGEDSNVDFRKPEDEALWLWAAHNKANKRLAGDASEDPLYPKQIYPPISSCPSCWVRGQLDEKQVLKYLINIYGEKGWRVAGTGGKRLTVKSADYDWIFNDSDLSLSIILYGIAGIVIMGTFLSVI